MSAEMLNWATRQWEPWLVCSISVFFIGACAAMLGKLIEPAAYRHTLATGALTCFLCLPLAIVTQRTLGIELLPLLIKPEHRIDRRATYIVERTEGPAARNSIRQDTEQTGIESLNASHLPHVADTAQHHRMDGRLSRVAKPWVLGLLSVWLIGLFHHLIRLAIDSARLRQFLHRHAEPRSNEAALRVFQKARARLGFASPVRLLLASEPITPFSTSVPYRAIVLPSHSFSQFGDNQLEQILLHELAHLLRRDQVLIAFQRLAEAAYWFLPPVWWVSRQLSVAREELCDNYVLKHHDALDYCETLLRVAHHSMAERGNGLAMSIKSRKPSQLLHRVRLLVSERRSTMVSSRPLARFIALISVVCICYFTGRLTLNAHAQSGGTHGTAAVKNDTDAGQAVESQTPIPNQSEASKEVPTIETILANCRSTVESLSSLQYEARVSSTHSHETIIKALRSGKKFRFDRYDMGPLTYHGKVFPPLRTSIAYDGFEHQVLYENGALKKSSEVHPPLFMEPSTFCLKWLGLPFNAPRSDLLWPGVWEDAKGRTLSVGAQKGPVIGA